MHKPSFSAIRARIKALKSRHLHISDAIRREAARPNPDQLLLQELKRRRLGLKDQITGLSLT